MISASNCRLVLALAFKVSAVLLVFSKTTSITSSIDNISFEVTSVIAPDSKKPFKSERISNNRFFQICSLGFTSTRELILMSFQLLRISNVSPFRMYKTALFTFHKRKLSLFRILAFFIAFLMSSASFICVSGIFNSQPWTMTSLVMSLNNSTSGKRLFLLLLIVLSPPAPLKCQLLFARKTLISLITSIAQLLSLYVIFAIENFSVII